MDQSEAFVSASRRAGEQTELVRIAGRACLDAALRIVNQT